MCHGDPGDGSDGAGYFRAIIRGRCFGDTPSYCRQEMAKANSDKATEEENLPLPKLTPRRSSELVGIIQRGQTKERDYGRGRDPIGRLYLPL